MTDHEDQNERSEYKKYSNNLNRILAILFVVALHMAIFLKILFLE